MSAVAAAPRLDAGVRERLSEAAEWRLIGLLIERPRGEWWSGVERLAAEVEGAGLREAAEAARRASEGDYLAVLGPGVVSAREVTHVPAIQPGRQLAEIAAFYEAFAYRPVTEEPLDHLSVEAGFFAYLCFKQAYANAAGDEEHARLTGEAAATFLAEHLAPCAAAVAHALRECEIEHLRLVAQVLAQRVGPPRGRPRPPADTDDDGCGLGCGLDSLAPDGVS